MSFASRLKERRECLGITQVQLANMLGVTKGAVGNYETGSSSPKAEILYRVFDVLKCDANFLFQDEMQAKKNSTELSYSELPVMQKYRALDAKGKEVVDYILDREHERCMSEREQPEVLRIAARGGSDGIANLTEEQRKALIELLENPPASEASGDLY